MKPELVTAGVANPFYTVYVVSASAGRSFALTPRRAMTVLEAHWLTWGTPTGTGFPTTRSGAPYASPNGIAAAGQVRVYSGATGLLVAVANGTTANGNFGSVIAAVGDYDGDGSPDFAADFNGGVRVISASNGAVIATIVGNDGYLPVGGLAGAGDLNGDGLHELWLTAHPASSNPSGSAPTPTSECLPDRRRSAPRARARPACRSCCVPARSRSEPARRSSGSSSCTRRRTSPPCSSPASRPRPGWASRFRGCRRRSRCRDVPSMSRRSSCSRRPRRTRSDTRSSRYRFPGGMGLSGYFASFQCYVLNPGAVVMPGALTGALQVLCL